MIPARVEPCFEMRRKISPGRPSSYSPTVTKPLQSATRNSKVREVRLRGQLLPGGHLDDLLHDLLDDLLDHLRLGAGGGEALGERLDRRSFLAVDSGWATLQLSR